MDSGQKKTVEGGDHLIMWKVDTPGTVDVETMYHEESGHTRNCVRWDHVSCHLYIKEAVVYISVTNL